MTEAQIEAAEVNQIHSTFFISLVSIVNLQKLGGDFVSPQYVLSLSTQTLSHFHENFPFVQDAADEAEDQGKSYENSLKRSK